MVAAQPPIHCPVCAVSGLSADQCTSSFSAFSSLLLMFSSSGSQILSNDHLLSETFRANQVLVLNSLSFV
jgi:hypothetical protein